MGKLLYKLILITLCSSSGIAVAAGTLCGLSSSPIGSAYINLHNDGRIIPPLSGPAVSPYQSRLNFGVDSPYSAAAGPCQISGLANDSTAPLPGYGLQVISNVQNIYDADGLTTVGNITERIWRKTTVSPPMCILGTKITLNTSANAFTDIARGGFAASGAVNIGYFSLASTPPVEPVFRAGRTFTSVQHRPYKFGGSLAELQNNGIGYLDLPTVGGALLLNMNGVNAPVLAGSIQTTGGDPTLQDAQVNSNWVDFTLLVSYPSKRLSPMTYVEFPCNNDSNSVINSTWRKPGALRLRNTLGAFIEKNFTGFAPPGATVP